MKPFDLQAAIRHEPVVTRDGRPYTFGAYNPNAAAAAQVVGWIGDKSINHYQSGRRSCNGLDDLDLFMAPRKRAVFINICSAVAGKFATPCHETEESAKLEKEKLIFNGANVIAGPIRVEFEE